MGSEPVERMRSENALRREHLRHHLTDGFWHDGCRWCLRRRVYGGTGTEILLHTESEAGNE